MVWPTSDVVTTAMDAGTDVPPRAEFLSWAQKFNQMRAHVTAYMQGLLDDADAAAARTTLDVPSRSGANASGTWGIGISGNAATATTATNCSRSVLAAGLATGGGALSANRTITVAKSTQAQAEAGTDDATAMTPLRTAQAITARAAAIGVNQTWQTPARVVNTTYQNTTGRPIALSIRPAGVGGVRNIQISANGSTWVSISTSGDVELYMQFGIVPVNHYYRFTGEFALWAELR